MNNKLIRNNDNPEISSCIIAGYHKMDGRNNQYISEQNKLKRIGGIYDTEERKSQAGSIYDPNAISPTLTTMFPGGDKQPFVLVNEGTKKKSIIWYCSKKIKQYKEQSRKQAFVRLLLNISV